MDAATRPKCCCRSWKEPLRTTIAMHSAAKKADHALVQLCSYKEVFVARAWRAGPSVCAILLLRLLPFLRLRRGAQEL